MIPRGATRFFLLLALLCAPAASLDAQAFGGSAGIAVPVGTLAANRDLGLRVQGSYYTPGGRLRADVAGVYFPGNETQGQVTTNYADWRSLSLGVNFLPRLRPATDALTLRALLGLSAHTMSIKGDDNPYGIVPGLQLGGVLEHRTRFGMLTAEAGYHIVASDYGVAELEPVLFVPVLIGFRF